MRLVVARSLPSLAASLFYALFVYLWFAHPGAYQILQRSTDDMANPVPYSDLFSVLQANFCVHQGVNVYAPNPCMYGGEYNYSPFLLHVLPGLGPDLRFPLGFGLGLLVLFAATLLPPATGMAALAVRAAALCSGVLVWALESANLDCLLFVLCLAALWLLRTGWGRYFGYALFALGAAVKFYPGVLLALSLRERPRRFALMAGVLAAGGGVFLWRYGPGVATALAILPSGLPFRGLFGALDWSFGLALLRFLPVLTMEPNVPQYFAALHQPYVVPYIVITARLLVLVGLFTAWRLAPGYAAMLRRLSAPEQLCLAAGALIFSFCFFATQNLEYRAIYLLLVLPGLQRAAHSPWLLAAILAVMWEGALRHAVAVFSFALLPAQAAYVQAGFWLLREYFWWFIAVRLGAIALMFLRLQAQTLLGAAGLTRARA